MPCAISVTISEINIFPARTAMSEGDITTLMLLVK